MYVPIYDAGRGIIRQKSRRTRHVDLLQARREDRF
jgi:hypothetical protein